jgi:hexosaminidase
MKFIKIFTIVFFVVMIAESSTAQYGEMYPLIPFPEKFKSEKGLFVVNPQTGIIFNDPALTTDVKIFNDFLQAYFGFRMEIKLSDTKNNEGLFIALDKSLPADSYSLTIDSSGVTIKGGKDAGVFYALQTFIQLIPPVKSETFHLPYVDIEDSPKFKYRGMHLDVARHFFSVEAVKKYIDFLAMYKMNVFHWHLTDDQGWRIEIKKYPKLQQVSAWRKGTLAGHLGDKPEQYDTTTHGGFYSQNEIKDVVNYALQRHVTVIPEIEMPGHALAALAAYPELSCTGGQFEVGKKWGVFKDVYCTKEETFLFLLDVIDEVCELFPAKYFHIGGDECPKDQWKECKNCQSLIKRENLADENQLQRYFTNRIAAYLKTKNKIAIGWDEILEEGLDSDAVVMSYRGYSGGANAAIKGHDVVMAPASHTYFDMYQSRNTGGRIAIGGYIPVDMVYSFEPVPDVLNKDQAKHILGAQGNVWTEYISTEDRLQEMIFPRMAALAENLWTKREKDYGTFASRLVYHFKLLKFAGIKYSTAVFDISSRVIPNGKSGIFIELFSGYPRGKIYYTMNGNDPTIRDEEYKERIAVDQSVGIRAALFEGGRMRGTVFSKNYQVNKATGKQVLLKNTPHEEYSRGGAMSLVDGYIGDLPWLPSDWLGFPGTDLEAEIDLDTVQTVSRVTVDVLKDELGKIYLPKEIAVYTKSNGKDYKLAAKIDQQKINDMQRRMQIDIPRTDTRNIKIIARNFNGKDWLFVDEIIVE